MNGILLVDKPEGWTSHDVVAKMRHHLGVKKIGHAGTLDPLATGLLILLVGNATKISQYVTNQDKRYTGTFCLGVTTDTYDAEGEVVETREVDVTDETITATAKTFLGEQQQLPPMFSAKKCHGKPLYLLARQGHEVERKPCSVRIDEFEITKIALPHVAFDILCSKGTYVRTLAHDFGEKLGCGAYLSQLRRTQTGNFSIDQATSLTELLELDRISIEPLLLPITDIL